MTPINPRSLKRIGLREYDVLRNRFVTTTMVIGMLGKTNIGIKTGTVANKRLQYLKHIDLVENIFDEEGNIIVKFKQKAIIKSVKGTFEVKIPKFDSHGKPLSDCKIGGGSKIKLCFSVSPYYVPSTRICGLSLRPVAVQVVELHEYAQGGTMESYGFSEEEGGYSAPEDKQDDPPFDWQNGDDLPDVGAGEANNF